MELNCELLINYAAQRVSVVGRGREHLNQSSALLTTDSGYLGELLISIIYAHARSGWLVCVCELFAICFTLVY